MKRDLVGQSVPGSEWWNGSAWVKWRLYGDGIPPGCNFENNAEMSLTIPNAEKVGDSIDGLVGALVAAGLGFSKDLVGQPVANVFEAISTRIRVLKREAEEKSAELQQRIERDVRQGNEAVFKTYRLERELAELRKQSEQLQREHSKTTKALRDLSDDRRFRLVELAMGRGLDGPAAVKEAAETIAALRAADPTGRQDSTHKASSVRTKTPPRARYDG